MGQETNYIDIDLVNRAKSGDEESLEQLSKLATGGLRSYLRRLTLNDELASEIVQESMLEMVKFLNNLNDANKFWPWLRKIATNKFYRHAATAKKRKTVAFAEHDAAGVVAKDSNDGFANLVTEEFKQIVVASMQDLKPRHRQVLVLRCYDGLGFSQIADEMDGSEFGVKMLFSRAKKSLAKRLARRGLGKGALIVSLTLFGKLTAANEVAAANICVTATTLKAGLGATAVVTVTSKAVLTTTAAAGILAGAAVVDSPLDKTRATPCQTVVNIEQRNMTTTQQAAGIEQWFYFPERPSGAVMMRRLENGKGVILQNESANYRIANSSVVIENYNYYNEDFSVMRLPTDGEKLSGFLDLVEGKKTDLEYIAEKGRGLLVVASVDNRGVNNVQMRHYNTLDESYFRCDWPSKATIRDNRDAMHKRGWAFFSVSGRIGGQKIAGAGRVPFVYEQASENFAWMKLRLGKKKVFDFGFDCFARPWQGLHTIDVIRRDAAGRNVKFVTELCQKKNKALVTLYAGSGELIYSVDLERDLVESIEMRGEKQGIIEFEYLNEAEVLGSQYRSPEYAETNGGLWNVLTN